MLTKRDLLRSAALGAVTATAAKSIPALGQTGVTPAEARAIAKEAYIYGFPMVDNYRIQYAYFVDRAEPRVQGAVEPDPQHPARLHAGGHGDPNAQLGHALFLGWPGPARRARRAHRAGDRKGALLQHPAHRRLHLQFRLHRQPRHRQRWRQLPHRRAGLERRDAQGREEGDPLARPNSASPSIARSSSIPATSTT